MYSRQKVRQLHKVWSVKHLIYLPFKNGQQFQIVHNKVSNRSLCEQPPLWIPLTLSSCLSLYLANSLLTASYLEASCNCLLNMCANNLPSSGIDFVILEAYFVSLIYAVLAKLAIFTLCTFSTCIQCGLAPA